MRRGEIWWAELSTPVGKRPVLLLSRDSAYRVRTSVTVAVITRTMRGIPVEVPIGPNEGMPTKCVVNVDDIITIPKAVLTERLTTLPPEKMKDVSRAVIFALDQQI